MCFWNLSQFHRSTLSQTQQSISTAALSDMWLSLGIQPSALMPSDYFYLLLLCPSSLIVSIFSSILCFLLLSQLFLIVNKQNNKQ